MITHTNYRVGIDVGTNSVGFAAVEVDDSGMPTRILNSVVHLHDSGVDPEQAKAAVTRRASSGVARRTRRLIKRRKKRLRRLDQYIEALGWPIVDHESSTDPYLPWNTRAKLAQEKLTGDELKAALSIAVRHIARHRGWRSPYSRVESLFSEQVPSEQFNTMKERVTEISGVLFEDDSTPAEVVVDLGLSPSNRLRSAASTKYKSDAVLGGNDVSGQYKIGIFGGKLMQSDNSNELWKIARVQGLDEQLVRDLIAKIFESESPVGKAGERAGKDQLPGQGHLPRAPKPHPEFQRFRIVSVVANLRVSDPAGAKRDLTRQEKEQVIDLLMNDAGEDGVTWNDVAETIGIPRARLTGTASLGPDGERVSSFPPTNTTNRRIVGSKIKPLVEWWTGATSDEQAALIIALSNADVLDENEPGAESAREFLASLDEPVLEKIDGIKLPAGRAAYSVDSLKRLSERMLMDSSDLHEARKAEFGVDDSWVPPSDPIGAPVGNPGVDRVMKIVNRWFLAATKKWGMPASVNIEHVRSGFSSEAMVREYERDLARRNQANQKVVEEAHEKLGITRHMRPSDITRYLAIRRQNCQCAYCGSPITYSTAEMDHIVPRKGPGSTNTRDNLVAVCEICNKSKSNLPFAVWASQSGRDGVSVDSAVERVRGWIDDGGLNRQQNYNFKRDVVARLRRTSEDEEIDNRSIESVAWMANELRDRITAHIRNAGGNSDVRVFRGSVTAEARKASGLEGKVQMIGGNGKTRLDRRHHSMDAMVIALMSQFVAQTLAERDSIRRSEQLENRSAPTWKDYRGRDAAHTLEFGKWLNYMNRLTVLLNNALANDEIPVMQNVRLRLGNGTAHDATIRRFKKKRVGEAWTRDEVDCASTPQMWVALSRDPDFSEQDGLPENSAREIRVKNDWFGPSDSLEILPKKIAAIPVRGGYAEVGGSIHHGRLYRIPGAKKDTFGMVRVFGPDLQRHRNDDLFTVPLGPETISMRDAKPATRNAVLNGDAEYLGWIVPGTELRLDLRSQQFEKFAIGELISDFGPISNWTVKGFDNNSKITLKPVTLSSEGLHRIDHSPGSDQIFGVKGKGWRVEVGVLFSSALVEIIWRNALGTERNSTQTMLPSVILKG